MEILTLSDNPELVTTFAEIPHRLYRGDPHWIPPPAGQTEAALDRERNPFFRYGELEGFVAFRGEEPAGRCAAILNPRLERDGERVGLVGYFESEERYEVAEALLEAALAWLRARGAARAWGPMNFSMWHQYRLMTSGFDREPFLGEPYNPPYYPDYFERFGFEPLATYRSWDLDAAVLGQMLGRLEPFVPAMEQANPGYRSEPLRVDRFREEVARLHGVLSESFATVVEYSPIDEDELHFIFTGYDRFMVPELARIIIDPEDRPVGYIATYPDVAPQARGEDRGPDRVVLHTMALAPGHRRRKLIEQFCVPIGRAMLEGGYARAVGALAREGPTIYDAAGEPTRSYALYGRAI